MYFMYTIQLTELNKRKKKKKIVAYSPFHLNRLLRCNIYCSTVFNVQATHALPTYLLLRPHLVDFTPMGIFFLKPPVFKLIIFRKTTDKGFVPRFPDRIIKRNGKK